MNSSYVSDEISQNLKQYIVGKNPNIEIVSFLHKLLNDTETKLKDNKCLNEATYSFSEYISKSDMKRISRHIKKNINKLLNNYMIFILSQILCNYTKKTDNVFLDIFDSLLSNGFNIYIEKFIDELIQIIPWKTIIKIAPKTIIRAPGVAYKNR